MDPTSNEQEKTDHSAHRSASSEAVLVARIEALQLQLAETRLILETQRIASEEAEQRIQLWQARLSQAELAIDAERSALKQREEKLARVRDRLAAQLERLLASEQVSVPIQHEREEFARMLAELSELDSRTHEAIDTTPVTASGAETGRPSAGRWRFEAGWKRRWKRRS